MITQKFKQGNNVIRVESAENFEDAAKNNFHKGAWTRYFINDKPCASYYTMIQFIIEESKTNKLVHYSKEELIKIRNEMILNQNKERRKHFEKLKQDYINLNAPKDVLDIIDDAIKKINNEGVRINQ